MREKYFNVSQCKHQQCSASLLLKCFFWFLPNHFQVSDSNQSLNDWFLKVAFTYKKASI